MPEWIYLSKLGQDEYVNRMAQGAGTAFTVMESWQYDSGNQPLVIRGIMKHKLIKQCWQDRRPFRFIDTGYFGNQPCALNPHGWKLWHRIVPNNLQHHDLMSVPPDRWHRHGITLAPRRHGTKIVIAVPDDKPCIFYSIDRQQWLDHTITVIQSHTDRPIEIRQRDPLRKNRINNSLAQALQDAHALVTFNSNAATEAVMLGVPSFVLAPCHAASPVANRDLGVIDTPWWPDQDLRLQWAASLAYGQFHVSEMQDGTAHRILDTLEHKLGPLWNTPS